MQLKFLIVSVCFFYMQIPKKNPDYIPYYQLCNEAEYAYFEGDMQLCSLNLSKAFLLCPPKPKDEYLFAKINLYYDKLKEMEELLLASAATPEYDIATKFKKDSLLFVKKISSEKFTSIRIRITEIYNQERLKLSYIKAKDTMAYFYSTYREAHVVRNPYLSKEQAQDRMLEVKHHQKTNDSIFIRSLLNYIRVNGYPTSAPNEFHSLIPSYIRNNRKQVDTSLLYNEVKLGHMDPYYYGEIKQLLNLYFEDIFCSYYIDAQNCAQEDYEKIKANRFAIGMSNYFTEPRNCLACKYQRTPWLIK